MLKLGKRTGHFVTLIEIYLHLFLHSHCFQFHLGHEDVQDKSKTMPMQIFEG